MRKPLIISEATKVGEAWKNQYICILAFIVMLFWSPTTNYTNVQETGTKCTYYRFDSSFEWLFKNPIHFLLKAIMRGITNVMCYQFKSILLCTTKGGDLSMATPLTGGYVLGIYVTYEMTYYQCLQVSWNLQRGVRAL